MYKEIGYIYKIINKQNAKFYIGSTNDFNRRVYEHKYELNNGKHANKYLQSSWNLYGEDSFEFKKIAEIDADIRVELEMFYIEKLKPNYNMITTFGNLPEYRNEELNDLVEVELIRNIKQMYAYGFSISEICNSLDLDNKYPFLCNVLSLNTCAHISPELNDKIIRNKKLNYIDLINMPINVAILKLEYGVSNPVLEDIFRINRKAIIKYEKEYLQLEKNKLEHCTLCGSVFVKIKKGHSHCTSCRNNSVISDKYKTTNKTKKEKKEFILYNLEFLNINEMIGNGNSKRCVMKYIEDKYGLSIEYRDINELIELSDIEVGKKMSKRDIRIEGLSEFFDDIINLYTIEELSVSQIYKTYKSRDLDVKYGDIKEVIMRNGIDIRPSGYYTN
jgi:transposase-like protein